MFNIFKRRERRYESPCAVSTNADPIPQQLDDVRYFAEKLLEQHVGCAGLNKISKECVRNAMMLAHAMRLAMASYERELRAEAAKKAMAETAFTPEEDYDA